MIRRFLSAAIVAATLTAPALSAGDAPDEERPLAAAAIPADKSPLPKPNEWPAAPRVGLTRKGPLAAGCRAYLLREWLRVRCAGEAFALSLLGGDADVAFWIDPRTKEGEVLLPLRRGGRHVVQIWKAGVDGAGGFVPTPLAILQQHWIEGAPGPIVTLF